MVRQSGRGPAMAARTVAWRLLGDAIVAAAVHTGAPDPWGGSGAQPVLGLCISVMATTFESDSGSFSMGATIQSG